MDRGGARIFSSVIPAMLLAGCGLVSVQKSSTSSTEQISTSRARLPVCYAPGLRLPVPIVASAVGVSHYGPEAGVDSTPAHMLGAAIFHQPFKAAAWRTQQMLRDERTFGRAGSPSLDGSSETAPVLSIGSSPAENLVAALSGTATTGTIRLWNRRGEVVSQFSRAVAAKELRFASDNLLALRMDDSIELADLTGATSARFPHATAIKTFDVNLQRGLLLTVTADDVMHLWIIGGSGVPTTFSLLPQQCPNGYQERNQFRARFDSTGSKLIVSRCDGVWVYDVRDLAAPLFQMRIPDANGMAVVEISPDGSRTAYITADGDLRLGSTSDSTFIALQLKPSTKPDPYSAAVRPEFSSDGQTLTVQTKGRASYVWRLDSIAAGPTLFADQNVRTFKASANGQSMVGMTEGHVYGWNFSATQTFGPITFASEIVLASPALRGNEAAAVPTTTAINRAGSVAWVGYNDGSVRAFGLNSSAAIESRFHVSFDGDVYVSPTASTAEALSDPTIDALTTIGGVDWVGSKSSFAMMHAGQSNSGPPTMTRKKVEDLRGLLFQAEQAHRYNGSVVVILYIAAHGWIGADGHPVVLPGDAKAADSSTWIPYQSFVGMYAQTRFFSVNADRALR